MYCSGCGTEDKDVKKFSVKNEMCQSCISKRHHAYRRGAPFPLCFDSADGSFKGEKKESVMEPKPELKETPVEPKDDNGHGVPPEPEEPETQEEPQSLTVEKPLPTSPWKSTDNAWAPDRFKINRRPGWRPFFADKKNVTKKKEEGWRVANGADYGIEKEEGQIDTAVHRGGSILMEMPEEFAKDREAYFRNITKVQSRSAKEEVMDDAHAIGRKLGSSVDLEECK